MDPVFFRSSRQFTAAEIATITGAELFDPSTQNAVVRSIASLDQGGEGALVFVDGRRNAGRLQNLRAAAVLCPPDLAPQVGHGIAVLVTSRPQQAFAAVGRLLFPAAATPDGLTGEDGISPQAIVHPSAKIEDGATIESGAVIGAGAEIGRGTVIAPLAVIGKQCRIGRDGYVGGGGGGGGGVRGRRYNMRS
jgi:UDP-3-O-[3-hydroxymyristoyl] glucosamine N-acyltransferase